MKLSRLDACGNGKVVRWCRTQASSHNWQGVVDCGVDKAGMSTASPDRHAIAYSAVECFRARVAIRRVVAPAPQPEPASHLRSATHDVSFLRSDSRCRRYVSNLSNVTPRYFDSEQKSSVSMLKLTFSSHLAFLLLRWKAARDDRLVFFCYPILSCFLKVICISDPNPVWLKSYYLYLQTIQKCIFNNAQHTV